MVRVSGVSMEPTLRSGDLLLVRYAAAPRRGDLAVVRLPNADDGTARPIAVKRVTGTDPQDPSRWWVERDNPREGVDSWRVGGIPAADILAVVVARLWPHPTRLRPDRPA